MTGSAGLLSEWTSLPDLPRFLPVSESVKGRAVLPLMIQPSMLIASHLAALLQAGSGSLSGTVTGYPEQVRQAADGLKEAAEVLEEMAARASQAREVTRRQAAVNDPL